MTAYEVRWITCETCGKSGYAVVPAGSTGPEQCGGCARESTEEEQEVAE